MERLGKLFRSDSVRDLFLQLYHSSDLFLTVNASHTIVGNVHWIVPRPLNNLFTGRYDVLLRMEKALYGDHIDKQKKFAITGMGGQGKSEICLKFASQAREKYILIMCPIWSTLYILTNDNRFWGIFWVDVSKPSAAQRDFIAIAKVLGRSVESVHDALQVLANTKENWLLILDNADDPGFDYQCYLPSGTMGSIIMTSRIPKCRQYSPDAAEALEGLDNSQSRELLLKAAGFPMEMWPSLEDQADEIIRLLGSHTLALITAGAYIANGHCQLHQYTGVYQRQRKRVLQYGLQQAQPRYGDVYATFEASANVLEQSQDQAAKDALSLLEILSMLDSSVLPLQIFQEAWKGCGYYSHEDPGKESKICRVTSGHVSLLPSFIGAKDKEWDPYRLVEASSLLVSLSLATRHDLEGSIGLSMHPLTHAWAKERQKLEQQGISWIAAGCVLALAKSADYWKTQGRIFLPHILSFLDMGVSKALPFGPKATIVPIFGECGWALHWLRQDSTLGRLLEELFVETGQSSDEPSIEYLPLYRLWGRTLRNLGKRERSVQLLEKAVKIGKSEFAEDDPNHLRSQHELAIAYESNGQVEEAIQLLKPVVKIRVETLAEDHPGRLASQHALAGAYKSNGQVEEAIQLLEHVVKIKGLILAENHPDLLDSQHVLAGAYMSNGQVEEAIQLLERVVEIEGTSLAEVHPSRLDSQHELARAYMSNGQDEKAIELLEQVVRIRRFTLNETHPDRLVSEEVLASFYRVNGRTKEAVEILEQVVKMRMLKEDHSKLLISQHNLACAYMSNGQDEKAIKLMEHVVRIKQSTLDEGDPDRVGSEAVLASFYKKSGRTKEAVEILKQVVKMRMLKEDSKLLTSQHNLACAYMSNGQDEEAIKLMEHVVKIEQSTLEDGHPDRVVSEYFLTQWLQDTRPISDGNTGSGMGDAGSETNDAGLASRSLGPNTTGPELIL
jgi:tetratricopeptide (TPR) repeat protein